MQNQRMTFVFAFLVFSLCLPTLAKGTKEILEDLEESSQNKPKTHTSNSPTDEERANQKKSLKKQSLPPHGKKITKRKNNVRQSQRKKRTSFGVTPNTGLSDATTAHSLLLVTPQQPPALSVAYD